MTPALPEEKPQPKLAKLSFYLGLLSVLSMFINMALRNGLIGLASIIIGIAAVITGIISLVQNKAENLAQKRTAIAGIVLGCIPGVLTLLAIIFFMWLLTLPS